MTSHAIQLTALFGMLAIAVWHDLRERRIPNRVALALLLSGLALGALRLPAAGALNPNDGGPHLAGAAFGALAGLALTLPLHWMRALGAGDAKLLAAIGAWVGPWQIVGVILLAGIAGAALSIVGALWLRYRGSVFGGVRMTLFTLISGAGNSGVSADVRRAGSRLPYAAAIACGAGLQLALSAHGGWAFA
jgi:prepilin peptidase CpaA